MVSSIVSGQLLISYWQWWGWGEAWGRKLKDKTVRKFLSRQGRDQSSSSMHHCECVVLYKDISLQRGRFWASSLASFSSRSREEKLPWVIFIQVVRGHPAGRLQLSGWGSKMTWNLHSYLFSQDAQRTKDDETWVALDSGWVVAGWSCDERQHFSQNYANKCQGFYIDTTGPVNQFAVGPPCWLPNIQTCKALSGV